MNCNINGYIKIWAMVGLAAIKGNTTGAWRAWQICKHIDQEGSGKVSRVELWTYLDYFGVGDRKRRRWFNQAVKLGLLMFDARGGHYYMVSLAQAAVILNCRHVGRPAEIRLDAFVKTGWRENVWSAYLATTNNRPISQARKAKLTGVKVKTQYRYQSRLLGEARRNYSQTDFTSDHVQGLRDRGVSSAFAGKNGKVFIRLPDIRTVPGEIARTLHKGRSKKAQKQVNLLLHVEREKGSVYKLFFEKYKSVTGALKKFGQSDHQSWKLPEEIFFLSFPGKHSNIWRPIQVSEMQAAH